jgi:diguanylate cyclase (GGDEF)-like protein
MPRAANPPVMALVTGIAEYHLRVISGMAQALAGHGIPLLVTTHQPFGSESTPSVVLDLIRRHVPRAVLLLSDTSHFQRPELLAALAVERTPTVTLGTKLPGSPRVLADNNHGIRELMAHLLDERGVRRPALVRGIPDHIDSVQRERVFRAELIRRGITFDEGLAVNGWFRPNQSFEAVRELLDRRQDFDALVALNDTSASGALSALARAGLRVPEDLLLSGFDNTDGSRLSWPALTTVDPSLEEQGRCAAECAVRLAAGGDCPDDVVVPSHLIVRASTTPGARHEGDLATTTLALQERVALQDAALNLSWTTSHCRTLNDVIAVLDPCLSRLGVARCFIAIDNADGAASAVPAGTDCGVGDSEHPSTLVLSHRGRPSEPTPVDVFARHELLPGPLRTELDHGVLLLQPLAIAGRERGFLLYEPVLHSYLSTEALRVDLTRAIDMVLSTREMSEHAAELEHVVAQRTRELERVNAELQGFVMRDGLTGIANRMAFQQVLDDVWSPRTDDDSAAAAGVAMRAGGVDVAVMMIDVDMFKAFNDRYGHLAGDEALKGVAACLRQAMRGPQDLACRYGGEEFAVVLRDADRRRALAVAERFRALLAGAAIPHEASPIAPVVTASVGIATVRVTPSAVPMDVVAAADQALYRAKLDGRDRIVISPHRPAEATTTARRAV